MDLSNICVINDTNTQKDLVYIPEIQRVIYFNKIISNLKHNLIKCKKNTIVNLTAKDLNEIYIKQKGKCVFSKKDLTFNYNKGLGKVKIINDFNISISRINTNEPYNRDNVQLVACRINLMKNTLSNSKFVELCNKVVKNCNLNKKLK